MIRTIFAILLIISFAGIGVCDLFNHDYKTFALGFLYTIASILIFLVK